MGITNEMVSGYREHVWPAFLSTELAWGNSSSETADIIYGESTTQNGIFYAGAQPNHNWKRLDMTFGFHLVSHLQMPIYCQGCRDFQPRAKANC